MAHYSPQPHQSLSFGGGMNQSEVAGAMLLLSCGCWAIRIRLWRTFVRC
jgi:hypothetical protein